MTTTSDIEKKAPEPKTESKEEREGEKKGEAKADASKDSPKSEPPYRSSAAPELSMQDTLTRMKTAFRKVGAPSYEQRMHALDRLEKLILGHKHEIAKAISQDFGNRSKHEWLVAEVFITHGAIKHAREHLREWMEVEPRDTKLVFMPARVELMPQPLGVVGIIAPWNYPGAARALAARRAFSPRAIAR